MSVSRRTLLVGAAAMADTGMRRRTLVLSCGMGFTKCRSGRSLFANSATHWPIVQHQLIAAHVDKYLPFISPSFLVELCRNHDTRTRRFVLIHCNKKQVPVSKAELDRLGRIIKIDLSRQGSEFRRCVECQTSLRQKGARDRLVS
jgi:hypothetical protein